MVRAAARRSKDGLSGQAASWRWPRFTEGASRTEAAKVGGVTLQIVRDWVMKFNAHGPEGLIDRKPPGQPSRLNGAHRAALAAILESGPIPWPCLASWRWRIVDLCQWMFEEFRVVVAKQTLSRELRAMGYRKLSARPRHHEQAEGAIEDFKKLFPRAWTRSGARRGRRARRHRGLVRRRGPHRPEEQDHPAVGLPAARVRARRTDQRTASAYIFGAICPKHGKGAALIMPRCNTEAMNLHLAEIATQIAPGAHAALLVDQAGWHLSWPARHAAQHHLDPVAGEMSGAQSAGKRLAVSARQLALKPDLQILRRRRQPLLRGLEQARRSTLADHLHRPSQLGPWVLINESWYKR